MGIILLPIFVCALVLFFVGITIGYKGLMIVADKSRYIVTLLLVIILFHSVLFLTPFFVQRGNSIYAFSTLTNAFFWTIMPALLFSSKVVASFGFGDEKSLVIRSALKISAGLTLFTWFSFSEQLQNLFDIKLTF